MKPVVPLALSPRPLPGALVLATALATLAAVCVALAMPAGAKAEPVQISDGTLAWGIKASWRAYAGPGDLSGGVVQDSQGLYRFPIESGSYDADTGTTTIAAKGSIHWQAHYYPNEKGMYQPPAGYTGPLDIYILDLTLTDPALTISADGSVLTVEARSRDAGTWDLVDLGRTELVELDPSGATPSVAGGTTTWNGIFAALTEGGAKGVFGGNYAPGVVVDPVGFTYTGPGGAPDFSEQWAEPDSTGLSLAANGVWGTTGTTVTPRWVDPAHRVLHDSFGTGASTVFRSFDLATGAMIGQPYTPTATIAQITNTQAFTDSGRNSVYFSSNSNTTMNRVLRWNTGSESYEEAAIEPFTVVKYKMHWDAPRDRAIAVVRTIPAGASATDWEAHEWYVVAYVREEDGGFEELRYRLPNAPTGWNRAWYNEDMARAAVASDGSIILPRPISLPTQAGMTPAPVDTVGTQRIVLDDATKTASVTEIPGSQAPPGSEQLFENALATANGHVALVTVGVTRFLPTRILQYDLDENGVLVSAGPQVELLQQLNAAVAISPVDGTVWHNDNKAQRLNGVRDGRLVYSKPHQIINTRTTSMPTVGTLPDGDVWFVSSDGTPTTTTSAYGYARFDFDGYTPKLTGQPGSATVTVAPGGTAPVVFSAGATGSPTPDVRWQRRAPGSARFVNLAGATAATLEIAASAADNGAAYRAVFGNAAGQLATEAASLTVRFAPTIAFQPADSGATEGEDVTFTLLAGGSPEPAVSWQRRVGGYWEAVDPDSGDFEIAGNDLTVHDVNTEMDGSLFRARVANDVGIAHSRSARLTVRSAVGEPVTFGSGSFDWGFANRWRCYVVGTVAKGGIELDGGVTRIAGTAATGGLCPAAGVSSEALRFPVRGGSYDPATGELEVKMNGSVRFWGHGQPGTASPPQLDTTFSNLRLLASGGTGTLYADAIGATQANPVPVTRKGIALVAVDLAAAGPAPSVDGLAWTSAPTALTAGGVDAFGTYPQDEPFDPISMALVFGTPQPDPESTQEPAKPTPPARAEQQPQPAPRAKALIVPGPRNRSLGGTRTARLATLGCPTGTGPCRVQAPRRIVVRVGGTSYRARVLVPQQIGAGRQTSLRVRLPLAAAARLGNGRARVAFEVRVLAGSELTKQTLRVTLRS